MGSSYRVGIDGFNLAIPRGTGVATYARSLAATLTERGHPVDLLYGMDVDPARSPLEQQVAFFEQLGIERPYRRPRYPSPGWMRAMVANRRGFRAAPLVLDGTVDPRPVADRVPPHARVLNAQHLFARASHFFHSFDRFVSVRVPDPPAVMHWTYPVPVRLEGARNVYTVHDMVPLRMPYATLDNKAVHRRLLAGCLRTGDHVVTVSERSREDVLAFFPDADPARITNTYQALPPAPPAEAPEVRDRLLADGFGLRPGGYFLFFGAVEPKKNVARLLEGFLASNVGIPLVLVTGRSWQAGAEAALLDAQDARDGTGRIRRIDYLPAATLSTLVRGARAVTFPSIYEGFGLPVLEAMAAGTPVLTTREGSLPEVAGEAALFVDAFDPASIAAGLERLAADDALCAQLREAGPARAARFGAAEYGARVTALYDAILAGPAR